MDNKILAKELDDMNLEYYGVANVEKFINGLFQRKKNGNISYPLELPSSILKDHCKGIPSSGLDYEIRPLLLFVKNKK